MGCHVIIQTTEVDMTRYSTKNRDPLDVRLWQRVTKTETCWNWTGKTSPKGYGAMRYHGRRILVHRASWELAYGPIPPDQNVLHHCDNPACVRPDHLFLGTLADNNHDMQSKGRYGGGAPSGEANPASKLTEEQVRIIRDTYKPHHPTYGASALSRQFGVSSSAIRRVLHHITWQTD